MNVFFNGPQGSALKELAETLWKNGFKVFLAGGCVRDHLLGRPYKDLDVVTDASVEQVQALFEKTIPVGVQFGIVRVLIHGHEFEVARFRSDGTYRDGRHPDSVIFAGPEEDAARRDFTVNALFFDLETEQILDYVGGRVDLQKKLLRAVGDPKVRFAEDYLRILRLLRFACQLDFQIDPETAKAAEEQVEKIVQVSGERLRDEIGKTLAANPRRALEGFRQWHLPQLLFPQWPSDSKQDLLVLGGGNESGWWLSQWLLNFQSEACEVSLVYHSASDWSYSPSYLSLVQEMSARFCLSKDDQRLLKELGAVRAWATLWPKLRLGFRGALAQSMSFEKLLLAAQQLGCWPQELTNEIVHWRSQPTMTSFLTGHDVLSVKPENRGSVLKECLYLQYEKVLMNREEALHWLASQLPR